MESKGANWRMQWFPLTGNGFVPNIYPHLWRRLSSSQGVCEAAGLSLPHTVIFHDSVPDQWFFTSRKTGAILRKKQESLTENAIFRTFTAVTPATPSVTATASAASARSKAKPSPIPCAVVMYEDPKTDPMTDATPQVVFEYLTLADLNAWLMSPAKPARVCVLQQFVQPRGSSSNNHVIRVHWTPDGVAVHRRINVARLTDPTVHLYERTLTWQGMTHNSVQEPVLDPEPRKRFDKACRLLAEHFSVTLKVDASVERLVLFLKEARDGRVYLLWCGLADVVLDRDSVTPALMSGPADTPSATLVPRPPASVHASAMAPPSVPSRPNSAPRTGRRLSVQATQELQALATLRLSHAAATATTTASTALTAGPHRAGGGRHRPAVALLRSSEVDTVSFRYTVPASVTAHHTQPIRMLTTASGQPSSFAPRPVIVQCRGCQALTQADAMISVPVRVIASYHGHVEDRKPPPAAGSRPHTARSRTRTRTRVPLARSTRSPDPRRRGSFFNMAQMGGNVNRYLSRKISIISPRLPSPSPEPASPLAPGQSYPPPSTPTPIHPFVAGLVQPPASDLSSSSPDDDPPTDVANGENLSPRLKMYVASHRPQEPKRLFPPAPLPPPSPPASSASSLSSSVKPSSTTSPSPTSRPVPSGAASEASSTHPAFVLTSVASPSPPHKTKQQPGPTQVRVRRLSIQDKTAQMQTMMDEFERSLLESGYRPSSGETAGSGGGGAMRAGRRASAWAFGMRASHDVLTAQTQNTNNNAQRATVPSSATTATGSTNAASTDTPPDVPRLDLRKAVRGKDAAQTGRTPPMSPIPSYRRPTTASRRMRKARAAAPQSSLTSTRPAARAAATGSNGAIPAALLELVPGRSFQRYVKMLNDLTFLYRTVCVCQQCYVRFTFHGTDAVDLGLEDQNVDVALRGAQDQVQGPKPTKTSVPPRAPVPPRRPASTGAAQGAQPTSSGAVTRSPRVRPQSARARLASAAAATTAAVATPTPAGPYISPRPPTTPSITTATRTSTTTTAAKPRPKSAHASRRRRRSSAPLPASAVHVQDVMAANSVVAAIVPPSPTSTVFSHQNQRLGGGRRPRRLSMRRRSSVVSAKCVNQACRSHVGPMSLDTGTMLCRTCHPRVSCMSVLHLADLYRRQLVTGCKSRVCTNPRCATGAANTGAMLRVAGDTHMKLAARAVAVPPRFWVCLDGEHREEEEEEEVVVDVVEEQEDVVEEEEEEEEQEETVFEEDDVEVVVGEEEEDLFEDMERVDAGTGAAGEGGVSTTGRTGALSPSPVLAWRTISD